MFRDQGDVINANVSVMARKRVEPEIASVTIAANQLTISNVPDQQNAQTAISHILLTTINVFISPLNRKFLQLRLKKKISMQMQKKGKQ